MRRNQGRATQLRGYDRDQFFSHGLQYYAAARMLFFAGGAPVTGNLAHHAIEMLLKGALCRRISLKQLADPRAFGHSLTRLWARFKMESAATALAHFDNTISALDTFAELRDPERARGFGLHLTRVPAPLRPTSQGFLRSVQLVLSDLDALVERILVTASVSPAALSLHVNTKCRAALARDNATWLWTERAL